MSKNLIPKDYARCDNDTCNKKMNCKRYLQFQEDLKSEQGFDVWVASFESFACLNQIENK